MPSRKGIKNKPRPMFPTSDREIKAHWAEAGKAAALILDPKDKAAAYARLVSIGAEYMYEKPKTAVEHSGQVQLVPIFELTIKKGE